MFGVLPPSIPVTASRVGSGPELDTEFSCGPGCYGERFIIRETVESIELEDGTKCLIYREKQHTVCDDGSDAVWSQ